MRYVFDINSETPGYVCRLPLPLAWLYVRLSRRPLDYWYTPNGL